MEENRHGAVWKKKVYQKEEFLRWTVEIWTNLSGLADGPYRFHSKWRHVAFKQAVFFMIWDYLPHRFGSCEVRATDKLEISLWLETMGA